MEETLQTNLKKAQIRADQLKEGNTAFKKSMKDDDMEKACNRVLIMTPYYNKMIKQIQQIYHQVEDGFNEQHDLLQDSKSLLRVVLEENSEQTKELARLNLKIFTLSKKIIKLNEIIIDK